MCGILCLISSSSYIKGNIKDCLELEKTIEMLTNRGPDVAGKINFKTNNGLNLQFHGHVLWQQGEQPCPQPISANGNILLMNGDIYSSRPNHMTISDTKWLFDKLSGCKDDDEFASVISNIKGPYSLVYFNRATESVYFLRDSLGRQSLLLGKSSNHLLISSVAESTFEDEELSCIELPPLGIFKINVSQDNINKVILYPWFELDSHEIYSKQLSNVEKCVGYKVYVESPLSIKWLVSSRSTVKPQWSFEDCLGDNMFKDPSELFAFFLNFPHILDVCDKLCALLEASVRDRCLATPNRCKECLKQRDEKGKQCNHSRVGILFSGGLDCTILALLADRFVNYSCPIDLINVSFEKVQRSRKTTATEEIINYNTPDRVSARDTLDELQTLFPNRAWNLIETNVTRAELNSATSTRIAPLIYPLATVLDEDLGAALWFAARGSQSVGECFVASNRVLLIGSGADELFGGYTRHRNAFCRSNGSWAALTAELCLDWARLSSRNLARDDRVIGDHGITARSPYIEEDLTHFVQNLDASQKCLHTLPQGVGDKLILRLCAYRLGLRNVCTLRKRALQFGSRIADSKQKANDKSTSLGLIQ